MKQVYQIDSEGYYVKPLLVENTPSNCVEEAPLNGLYKAKYVDGQWIEGLSQAEVDLLKNAPQQPSAEERIAALEEALLLLMMEG